MKIDLTKEQYESLVKMVYVGNWMINAVRHDEDQIPRYNELEQYMYSFAGEMGFEKYIRFDKSINKYITNWEVDEHPEVDRYIDEYDDETFWHELEHRLARRDLINTFGKDKVVKMTAEELIENEEPFIDKYSREISENGLRHLVIDKELCSQPF